MIVRLLGLWSSSFLLPPCAVHIWSFVSKNGHFDVVKSALHVIIQMFYSFQSISPVRRDQFQSDAGASWLFSIGLKKILNLIEATPLIWIINYYKFVRFFSISSHQISVRSHWRKKLFWSQNSFGMITSIHKHLLQLESFKSNTFSDVIRTSLGQINRRDGRPMDTNAKKTNNILTNKMIFCHRRPKTTRRKQTMSSIFSQKRDLRRISNAHSLSA